MERSFGADLTNSTSANESPGPGKNIGMSRKARLQAQASPAASSPSQLMPPPSSPATE